MNEIESFDRVVNALPDFDDISRSGRNPLVEAHVRAFVAASRAEAEAYRERMRQKLERIALMERISWALFAACAVAISWMISR